MKQIKKLNKKIVDFLYDHYLAKWTLDICKQLFLSVLAAFIYAFGFNCFITPVEAAGGLTIVTGGAGGIAQNIVLIARMFGSTMDRHVLQSILYLVINIPIMIFAFFAIGKKFAIMTGINVAVSSFFITALTPLTNQIIVSPFISGYQGTLIRVVFGAMVIGLSSAITFKAEFSSGGIDVFSYYFSLKKSTSIGKYTLGINIVIVGLYSVLSAVDNPSQWTICVITFLSAFVYLYISTHVVDAINSRNKKIQLQIITANPNVNLALLANFTHGSTIVDAKGGYSGSNKQIIYTVISSSELSKVIRLIKKIDSHAFIAVTNLRQVYGNFFIKPIE